MTFSFRYSWPLIDLTVNTIFGLNTFLGNHDLQLHKINVGKTNYYGNSKRI